MYHVGDETMNKHVVEHDGQLYGNFESHEAARRWIEGILAHSSTFSASKVYSIREVIRVS